MGNSSLNQKLSYIGVRIVNSKDNDSKSEWIDIEETIYDATFEVENDSRLFLLLCSWVKIHGNYVVIEKFLKLQKKRESKWLIALAIFASSEGSHKWKRLIKKVDGQNSLSTAKAALQSISYKGEVGVFSKYGFLIAKGSIRTRESDVATPKRLIKENQQYKNRLIFGANWRADIITAIQKGYENPYRITKAIGCSYPSAYNVFKDYNFASGV